MPVLFFGDDHADGMLASAKRNWGLLLGLGGILVVLGIIALAFSVVTTVVSVLAFAILLIIGGVMRLIGAFRAKDWGSLLLLALVGVLAIVVGALALDNPIEAAATWTLLFAALFLGAGLFRLVTAFALRYRSWGWSAFSGAVTALLGILIIASWPVSGLWFIGFAVALDLMLEGWGLVMLALAAKNA